MFLVMVNYSKPLEVIDALLPDHVRFLETNYAAGVFLVSGRRVPRTGGVILARSDSREDLEAILAQDPFAVHQAAQYQVMEFSPTMTVPELSCLLETASG